MQRQLPLLIFAQSGRYIAESATLAGYTVWVADCFCDIDTIAIAERSLKVSDLSCLSNAEFLSILDTLSRGEPCSLIIGTGIEHVYSDLNSLPDTIHYVGNSIQTLSELRHPRSFFQLLTTLQLPYPEVLFNQSDAKTETWVYKDLSGYGGQSIKPASTALRNETAFYQKWIQGYPASVCFLANGREAQVLNFNQQINLKNNYQLAEIHSSLWLNADLTSRLTQAINAITNATNLRGLCSLDFILNEDCFYILEVNPRISASAELVPDQENLFEYHLNALDGVLQNNLVKQTNMAGHLAYYYANNACVIIDDAVWPACCHDLPVPGSYIAKNAPICTILLMSETHAEWKKELTRQRLLIQQNIIDIS